MNDEETCENNAVKTAFSCSNLLIKVGLAFSGHEFNKHTGYLYTVYWSVTLYDFDRILNGLKGI